MIIYNATVNSAQRIIINNYLAAKYGLALAANDIYVQDNPPMATMTTKWPALAASAAAACRPIPAAQASCGSTMPRDWAATNS
jgi:hypothetical protein